MVSASVGSGCWTKEPLIVSPICASIFREEKFRFKPEEMTVLIAHSKVLKKIDGFEILDNKRLWSVLLLIFRQSFMRNFIGLLFNDTSIFTYSSARFKSLKVVIPCRLPKSSNMKQAFTFFLY